MIYVDTSAIVAALDSRDPRYGKAGLLLKNEKDKVVSEIVIVELASVLGRRRDVTSIISKSWV